MAKQELTQKVYKVVRKDGQRLRSIFARGQEGRTYKPNEWTEANPKLVEKGFGLMAFERKEHAENWLKTGWVHHVVAVYSPYPRRKAIALEVWECDVKDQMSVDGVYDMVQVKGGILKQKHSLMGSLPDGSIAFRAVKLRRRVGEIVVERRFKIT